MLLPRFASLTLAGGLLLSTVGCMTDTNGGGLFSRWRNGSCCGSTCGGTGATPAMPIPSATYAPAQLVPGGMAPTPVLSGQFGGNCNCPPGAALSGPAFSGAGNCNCPPHGAMIHGGPSGHFVPGGAMLPGGPGCANGACPPGGMPAFPTGLIQEGGAMMQQAPIGQVPLSNDMMHQVPMANNNPLILQPAPTGPQPLPSSVPNAPKIFTVPQPGSPTPSHYAVPEPYKPTTVIQPGI